MTTTGMTVLVVTLLGIGLGRAIEAMAIYVVWAFPQPAMIGLAVALVMASRRAVGDRRPEAVLLLIRLAGELRAGATLRGAVIDVFDEVAGHDAVVRLARSGRPIAEVGFELERSFGRHGRITGAAFRLAGRVGGSAAPVVEQLAAHVLELDDIARERRAAMAPAVLQAVVVGGVPLVALASMVVSGRWLALISAGGPSTVVTLGGTVLVVTGVAIVIAMVHKATR